MVQAKRNEAIKRLTDGRVNVLIATDVAARGIDIPDVSHVFNFDMPRTADTYLHRIGRTGRAGKKASPFLWLKRMTICCWVKLAAILTSR
jgi:ATP-dependent RNA helicase SrmB